MTKATGGGRYRLRIGQQHRESGDAASVLAVGTTNPAAADLLAATLDSPLLFLVACSDFAGGMMDSLVTTLDLGSSLLTERAGCGSAAALLRRGSEARRGACGGGGGKAALGKGREGREKGGA
ncbi:hypothetical protein GQ55_4G082500 [Panicum hallii var. hallii]|uniref:Uncharacterized protein n=1 Tax=Panicum hallii var. hallii TaxID=1504633 RepID=A0A2T7DWH2_9POAL|nr:hypothetical protein GQ55_4G082500 [Panicum hallii var. hallii]